MIAQVLEQRASSPVKGGKLSELRGKQLADKHPEIAEEYRGSTLRGLAKKYSPDYKISESVAINSIYNALRDLASRGLISLDELEEIGKRHIKENAEKNGHKTGEANGLANYEAKIGIGKLSRKDLHKQGRGTMVKRGFTPLNLRRRNTEYGRFHEGELIVHLKEQEFLGWKEIAEEVAIAGFSHRTSGTL